VGGRAKISAERVKVSAERVELEALVRGVGDRLLHYVEGEIKSGVRIVGGGWALGRGFW